MANSLKSLLCDPQGNIDEARIVATFMFVGFLYKTFTVTGPFDFQNWGLGAGALMAGAGAYLGMRKDN